MMKMKMTMLAGAVTSLCLTGATANAQTGPQEPGLEWGIPISANDSSDLMKDVGNQLGMIRSNELLWNQLSAVEFTANGSWADPEAGSIGEPQQASKYTYAYSLALPASRLDVEGVEMERTVRVVRADLDEAWDETRPGYVDGPSDNAAFREQFLWLWPHAFARAAAYAEQGKCPDGNDCDVDFALSEDGGATAITVSVDGVEYRGTLGEDNRPAEIAATIEMPGVGPVDYIARYADYRNGLGLGASGEEVGEAVRGLPASSDQGAARGQGILDKFHTGLYSPGSITHEADGQTVLELETTEVWPNAYMIFPTPEQLAAAQ